MAGWCSPAVMWLMGWCSVLSRVTIAVYASPACSALSHCMIKSAKTYYLCCHLSIQARYSDFYQSMIFVCFLVQLMLTVVFNMNMHSVFKSTSTIFSSFCFPQQLSKPSVSVQFFSHFHFALLSLSCSGSCNNVMCWLLSVTWSALAVTASQKWLVIGHHVVHCMVF